MCSGEDMRSSFLIQQGHTSGRLSSLQVFISLLSRSLDAFVRSLFAPSSLTSHLVPGLVSHTGQGLDKCLLQWSGRSIYLAFRTGFYGCPNFPEPPRWVKQRLLTFTVRERLCPLPLVQTELHRIPHYLEAGITGQADFGARLSISRRSSQVRYGSF